MAEDYVLQMFHSAPRKPQDGIDGIRYLIDSGCSFHNELHNLEWQGGGYFEVHWPSTGIIEDDQIITRIVAHIENEHDFKFRVYLFNVGCNILYSSRADYQCVIVEWIATRVRDLADNIIPLFFNIFCGFGKAAKFSYIFGSRNLALDKSQFFNLLPQPILTTLGSNIYNGIQWLAINHELGGVYPTGLPQKQQGIQFPHGYLCYPGLSQCDYLGMPIV